MNHNRYLRLKIFLLIVTLGFKFTTYSQLTISGRVTDNKGKLIEYATIIVKQDSTLIGSTLTDSIGNYIIHNLNKGNYDVIYSFINSKTVITLNIYKDTSINVQLSSTNNQLGNVIVSAKKPLFERKADRLIFNIENSVTAIGGDALDALKVTPGIQVQNDQIKIIGKSNVAIMIDDRIIQLSGDDLINFLKSMSSDNIKSLEIITNPSAKYDAQGNSGLINIKLKKIKRDSWNATIRGRYVQTTYPFAGIGESFNYQKERLSLSNSLDYGQGSQKAIEEEKIFYPAQLWSGQNIRKDFLNYIGGRINVDYKFSPKWVMGLQYLGNYNKPNINDNNLTTISNYSNVVDSSINTTGQNKRENQSHSLNWHSIIDIDTSGEKISIDFDYLKYKSSDNRNFYSNHLSKDNIIIPNTYDAANNTSNQNIDNYSGKIDIQMPLKWVNLIYGGKISFTKTHSNVAYFNTSSGIPIFDSSQSNSFEYTENTQALYISGNKKFGKDKWETQLGLRVEATQTNGNSLTYNQINKNNYTQLFPTAYITYAPNDNNTFSLNYGRRIDRPSYSDLNPFRWYTNPYSYFEGNPLLRPSYVNNIELNYIYKNAWVQTFSITQVTNGKEIIAIVNSNNNIQQWMRKNFYTSYTYNLTEGYSFHPTKWWESTNAINLYYTKTTSSLTITQPRLEGSNFYFSSNNALIVNKKKTILGEINYWFQSAGVSELDKNTYYSQLDIGAKLLFLKKKLTIAINAYDIFSTNRPIFTSYTNNIEIQNKNYYDEKRIRLSIKYSFGRSKLNIEQRTQSNEEERSRIGK